MLLLEEPLVDKDGALTEDLAQKWDEDVTPLEDVACSNVASCLDITLPPVDKSEA